MTTPTAWLVRALHIEGEILEWAGAEPRSVRVAWATCPHGDWLLEMAVRLRLDRAAIVRAALACVEVALADAPTDGPARAAASAALRWTRGATTSGVCQALGIIVVAAAEESPRADSWAALHAAAAIALACDWDSDDAEWAERGCVVEAVRCAFVQEPALRGRCSADLVRTHLPYEVLAPRLEPRRRTDPQTARTVVEAVGAARSRRRAS